MNMGRRAFLSILGGAVLDPERLLWKPKLISIPSQEVVDRFRVERYCWTSTSVHEASFREFESLFDQRSYGEWAQAPGSRVFSRWEWR